MEETQCVTVIITLLNKLLKPNVKISEPQVDSLVKCLTGISDNVVISQKLNAILTTWLSEAVLRWEISTNPDPAVLTLALNLFVYLSPKETLFLLLNNQNIFHRFIGIIKKAVGERNATPNIGYIRLISAFLKHNSGCQWITFSNHWADIIVLTLSSPVNSEFAKAGYKFVSKLIANSAANNFEFCKKVISLIIAPIIDIATYSGEVFDCSIILKRKSSFNLVNEVLENLMEERKGIIYEVVTKVINEKNFALCLHHLLKKISDVYISYPVMVMLHILGLYPLLAEQSKHALAYLDYECYAQISTKFDVFMKDALANAPLPLIVKFCRNEHRYYEKLGPLTPKIKTKDGIITSLHEQLLAYELYACCYVGMKLFGTNYYEDDAADAIRKNTVTASTKRILPETIRYTYWLRETFTKSFTLDDAQMRLKYFVDERDQIISKEIRTMSLQYLIIFLEDISIAIKYKPQDILKLRGKDTYILTLVQSITTLMKQFDFNWQDIYETKLLLDVTTTVLEFQTWEKEMYVCGFDLIGLAFCKHLTMNVAVLTNELKEDCLENIITLTQKKIDDDSWEVRCSAIGVIGAISKNAKRFSWLATVLLNRNLPYFILAKAFKDTEAPVRVSSLKCLQEMTQVDQLWNTLKDQCNFYDDLVSCLHVDVDPTVRSEAATLVATIYEHQEVITTHLYALYDVMSYTVVEDTNAKVKIASLRFWETVTHKCLKLQGMIDGEFPEVTFSKEAQKMVMLDSAEITNRILKALEQLSENGCLAVLLLALQDTPTVQNAVMTVMNKFVQQLKKHRILNMPLNFLDLNKKDSYLSNLKISKNMLGRKKISPGIFIQVLNQHLLLCKQNKPVPVSEELEMILADILHQNWR